MQDNIITEFLNFEDSTLIVDLIEVDNATRSKFVHISTKILPHYCEKCGARMHSKGIETRRLRHSILQDGYQLIIIYKQRRLKCTNPECGFHSTEKVSFISKGRRTTDVTDMLILEAFRDIRLTTAQIAERFSISQTAAAYTFTRYVDMHRLPLTEAICIDEVHIGSHDCKYAVLIQDFITGEPIDLKNSRKDSVMMPYLSSIPRKERMKVKYLVSDMFNTYISYVDKYFPNAVSVIDSFHVVKLINTKIDEYMRRRVNEFKKRDNENLEKLRKEKNNPNLKIRMSDEVYLFKKCKWIILSNQDNLPYNERPHSSDKHFRYLMDIYAYEEQFMSVDPLLIKMRDLKEKYISFNTRNAGDRDNAEKELNELITTYRNSGIDEFTSIASSLSKYKESILNSFIMIERIGSNGPYTSRLSNGPMEGLNRKPKDMKRNSRGFLDFEYLRNRFLFATRKNAPILASPKRIKDVRKDSSTGKKRGPYKKR